MALNGLTLLVVEDDNWILKDLQLTLEGAGAKTVCKRTLKEGLSAADTDYDAAILDLWLGDDMVFPLAAILKNRQIPLLFHSAAVELDAAAAKFPDAKVLSKPASDHVLMQSIRECVRER